MHGSYIPCFSLIVIRPAIDERRSGVRLHRGRAIRECMKGVMTASEADQRRARDDRIPAEKVGNREQSLRWLTEGLAWLETAQ